MQSEEIPVKREKMFRFVAPATLGGADLEAEILARGYRSLPEDMKLEFDKKYPEVAQVYNSYELLRKNVEDSREALLSSTHEFVKKNYWKFKGLFFDEKYNFYSKIQGSSNPRVEQHFRELGISHDIRDTDTFHLTHPTEIWHIIQDSEKRGENPDLVKELQYKLSNNYYTQITDIYSDRPENLTENPQVLVAVHSEAQSEAELPTDDIRRHMEIPPHPQQAKSSTDSEDSHMGIFYRDFLLNQIQNPKLQPFLEHNFPDSIPELHAIFQQKEAWETNGKHITDHNNHALTEVLKYEYDYDFQMMAIASSAKYFIDEASSSETYQTENKGNSSSLPYLLFISSYMRQVSGKTLYLRGSIRPRNISADLLYDIEGVKQAFGYINQAIKNEKITFSPGENFDGWLAFIRDTNNDTNSNIRTIIERVLDRNSLAYKNAVAGRMMCPPTDGRYDSNPHALGPT